MKRKLYLLIFISMIFFIGIMQTQAQLEGPPTDGGGAFMKKQSLAEQNDALKKALANKNTVQQRIEMGPTCGTPTTKTVKGAMDVNLPVDELFVLNAECIPSSGYKWLLEIDDENIVGLVAENLAPSEIPGMTVDNRYVLKGISAGTTTIRLVYKRPWETDIPPLKETIVNITSKGAYKGTFAFENPPLQEPKVLEEKDVTNKALPSSWDWRSQGKVTSVKNQGSTNACWAFGTCASTESAILISGGANRDLSEQYLCNCDPSGSCENGGWFAHWLFKDGNRGAVYQNQLTWTGKDYACGSYTYNEKITNWGWTDGVSDTGWPGKVHNAGITAIKQHIYDYGPVAASCMSDCWANSAGIQNVNCTGGAHIVVIVGWNDSPGYWIVKNSWGTAWGDKGYLYLYYGRCQMGQYSTYVTMGTANLDCALSINLSASSITNTSAYLDWDPPTSGGQASWNVQYRKAGTTTWTIKAATASNYSVTGLTLGTYYEFQVQTVCTNGGKSEWTASSTFTTTGGVADTQAPSVPTGLSSSNITQTGATISWTASTDNVGVTGYTLTNSTNNTTFNATTTSYAVTGLTANTTYSFNVKAKDAAGNQSAASSALSVTTTGTTSSCGLSINLSATSITNTAAYLDWDPPTSGGQSSWSVRYRVSGTSTWTTKDAPASNYQLSGLSLGTTYEWQVLTVCSGVYSAWTASQTFATTGASSCGLSINLSATSITNTSAYLDWDPPTSGGQSSWNLRYRTSGSSTWTTVASTASNYSLSGLTANTSYEFQVQTICTTGGTSDWTSSFTFSTTGSTIVNYCAATHTSILTYFYISNVSFGTINNTTTLGNTSTGYTDYTSISTSLSSGATATLSVSFTPNWSGNKGAVYIDWNGDGDFDDSGELVLNRSGATSPYTASVTVPTGAKLGATRMRVRVTYNSIMAPCGSIAYGETEDYTINVGGTPGSTLSTDSVENSSIVYPNPVKGILNIKFNLVLDGNIEIKVYTLAGEAVIHSVVKGGQEVQFDASDLSNGIYFYTVSNKNFNSNGKFIKE